MPVDGRFIRIRKQKAAIFWFIECIKVHVKKVSQIQAVIETAITKLCFDNSRIYW